MGRFSEPLGKMPRLEKLPHSQVRPMRTLTRENVACEERETKAARFRKMLPDFGSLVPMKTR